uniref:NADH-ubiquinone oxidoreductase chain 2 n=1 Tax=Pyrocoelia analis TaxID=1453205 RepID=A0A8K1RH39_9COLE|nr:NADH dehydrogenase subunit 2 [Pyrocoelia analis]UEN67841.1 NADH dehydrogenase subunit 2 [Pyrocoelia analis]UZG66107.1 NADH dehydrogenase subunit 2 [Pyrocoelia analis]
MTKFYMIIMFSMLIISTLISISSYSWMGMWLGLEINILSIIPIMINQKNKISSESAIKYFITQTIASTSIMLSITIMMKQFNFSENLIKELPTLIMNSGFLMKMGMAPFHFWFPEVLEGLSWNNSIIMLTWQKITPMVMLMFNIEKSLFFIIVIIISMVISSLMAINQISLRKILTYSSINHMGWMLSSMLLSQSIWLMYFIIYTITTINIAMIFNLTNTFFVSQLSLMWNFNPKIKLFFLINFLSFVGIPPFIGFFPKWLTIQILISSNLFFMSILMIFMTLIMIYVYLMLMIPSTMMNTTYSKWNMLNTFKYNKMMSLMNFFIITGMIISTILINYKE